MVRQYSSIAIVSCTRQEMEVPGAIKVYQRFQSPDGRRGKGAVSGTLDWQLKNNCHHSAGDQKSLNISRIKKKEKKRKVKEK